MKSNVSISQAKLMPASGRGNSLELAAVVSELRYRRLFETAQDGILILDAEQRQDHRCESLSARFAGLSVRRA